MKNLYDKNGIVFWTKKEIILRDNFETYFVEELQAHLHSQNPGFRFFEVEAPILTPIDFINPNYSSEDYFAVDDLALRPETTMGSYVYASHLLNEHNKVRLPIVVWQHGKSFRREQDQVTKNMRLKEFYQLEFQIIFASSTKNDYSTLLVPFVRDMISSYIGPCRTEDSDRLPDYAEWTKDVVCEKTNMEVCSISRRKDFEGAEVIEVAIGTDRVVYNFIERY